MKIAVFHNVPPGGAKRAVYEEVRHLANNHKLHLYEYSHTDEGFLDIRGFCSKVKKYHFEIKSTKPAIINRLERDYQNFILLDRLSKKIALEIDELNFDVCLVHPDRYTQAPFLLKYLKTPSLYFCEEYLRIVYESHLGFYSDVGMLNEIYEKLTRFFRKKIDRDNAKSASLVVANSKFTKRNIDKAYGINSKYCQLGVDVKVFKPRNKKASGNDVLFIGDKKEKGGFELAKKAVGRVGKKIRTKLVSLGLSKGKLKIQDDRLLAREYENTVAVLCTSISEPFGIAPLESMACEIPVLAVNEGGYKETVIHGKTGFLLPRDPNAFAEKIEYLIKNPDVAKKMGKAGREHVKKNFTWEKHSKKIEDLLIKLSKSK